MNFHIQLTRKKVVLPLARNYMFEQERRSKFAKAKGGNEMSISSKAERALLSHEEAGLLAPTHHPALADVSDSELKEARLKLREHRSKERTLVRALQRSIRGKAEERGRGFPGEVNKPARRKQVFAQALKRVNGELAQRQALAARTAMTGALQQALAAKRAARRHHPHGAQAGGQGMQTVASKRGHAGVSPARVGSVSKANKTAQAIKDSRN